MREEIRMQHSEATVKRLADVQYKSFSARGRTLWLAVSLLLILLGFGLIYDVGRPVRTVLLALGCLSLVNVGAPADIRADKTLRAIRQQGGEFPLTKMTFLDAAVWITEKGGATHSLQYADILRLVEDGSYYYLFITGEAAYMVPKEQIREPEAFRRQLETESKKRFTRATGLLTLRPRDILDRLRR